MTTALTYPAPYDVACPQCGAAAGRDCAGGKAMLAGGLPHAKRTLLSTQLFVGPTPGQRVLLASYSDRECVFVLRVDRGVVELRKMHGRKAHWLRDLASFTEYDTERGAWRLR